MTIQTLAKQGKTKIHTGLAGIDVAQLRKLRNEQIKACFSKMEETKYRREFVARIHNKDFINDASSCTVNATWYSLENMEKNVIWITMGDNAEVNYDKLDNVVGQKVKMIIAIGYDNSHIKDFFGEKVPNIVNAENLSSALHMALYSGLENVSVLFSPAIECSRSVEDLGEQFRLEVNEL